MSHINVLIFTTLSEKYLLKIFLPLGLSNNFVDNVGRVFSVQNQNFMFLPLRLFISVVKGMSLSYSYDRNTTETNERHYSLTET